MSIVMQFTGRFMLLQTGDYALALHRPGRYRPFASAAV
jgi:hypothetical protein